MIVFSSPFTRPSVVCIPFKHSGNVDEGDCDHGRGGRPARTCGLRPARPQRRQRLQRQGEKRACRQGARHGPDRRPCRHAHRQRRRRLLGAARPGRQPQRHSDLVEPRFASGRPRLPDRPLDRFARLRGGREFATTALPTPQASAESWAPRATADHALPRGAAHAPGQTPPRYAQRRQSSGSIGRSTRAERSGEEGEM